MIESPKPIALPLDPSIKFALESIRRNAQILKNRLEQLSQMHQHFSTANSWPEIVEKFVVLARTQYHDLQDDLSNLTKDYLIKPRSLYKLSEPQEIPEILRTKVEPEIEREQKTLVSEFTKNENLNPEEYDNNIEATRISIETHNKMIEDLLHHFEDLKKSLIESTKKELITSNIVMPDVTDKLILYYNAVNHGEELCNQPEIENKEAEMEAIRIVKKPILSDGEKQKELLERSKKRKLEKLQALQAPTAMSTPNPIPPTPVPSPKVSTISLPNIPLPKANPAAIITPGATTTTPILPPTTGIQPYQNINRGIPQYSYQNMQSMNPIQPNMRGGSVPSTNLRGLPIVSGYNMNPSLPHRGIPVPGVPVPGQVPQMMGGPQNPIPVSGQPFRTTPQKKR